MQPDPIPYGYCQCGCGEKTSRARDAEIHGRYAKGEPRRFIVGHNRTGLTFPLKVTVPPPNPSGICQCGCGLPAPIATRSDSRAGHVRGEAMRFRLGHNGRKRPHVEEEPHLCACGCGELTTVYQGIAKRYVHGHNAENRVITEADYRVEDRGYKTPCWIWVHALGTHGRGMVEIDGVKGTAYRAMYTQAFGEPPTAHDLHHLCEVPACVRPDHLQPLTHPDHMRLHRSQKRAHQDCSPKRVA